MEPTERAEAECSLRDQYQQQDGMYSGDQRKGAEHTAQEAGCHCGSEGSPDDQGAKPVCRLLQGPRSVREAADKR